MKRVTKQVRVELETHRFLKLLSVEKEVVISKIVDDIIREYRERLTKKDAI